MATVTTDAINRATLFAVGVRLPLHQRLLLDRLPCSIESVKEALADKTLVQVNAPRALMVTGWQYQVEILAAVEKADLRRQVNAVANSLAIVLASSAIPKKIKPGLEAVYESLAQALNDSE